MYCEFDENTPFDHMDQVKDGSIHIKRFKFEVIEGVIWIRVLKTLTDKNCDEIPYWAKLKVYPNELEKILNEVNQHKEDAQLGLIRYSGGPLGVVVYVS